MKTHIVQIGNSQGIRIPKVMIQQCGFEPNDQLMLKVEANNLIISKPRKIREGWSEAFTEVKAKEDDVMFEDAHLSHSFDNTEWTW